MDIQTHGGSRDGSGRKPKSKETSSDHFKITIKNIPSDSHTTLKAISKNLGIPMGSLIKSKLPDIINQYPASIRAVRHLE